jgi:hypothetical protein
MEKADMEPMKRYHDTRFTFDRRREMLWKVLCDSYFQKLVPPEACVMELGTGYGHFINNIRCARRMAFDSWAASCQFLTESVEVHIGNVTDLSSVKQNSVDFVLASNLFEHLSKDDFSKVLYQLREKLKCNGTINILQPNYRFAYREYFDVFTHISVYSDISL